MGGATGCAGAVGGGIVATGAASERAAWTAGAFAGAACSLGRDGACSSRAAGGFTTIGGCTTTTTGRTGAAAPAGALATTGPVGGRDAIAGGAGGGTIAGADRC